MYLVLNNTDWDYYGTAVGSLVKGVVVKDAK